MEELYQPRIITNKSLIGKYISVWIELITNDIIEILDIKDEEKIKEIRENIKMKCNIEYSVLNILRKNLVNNK